MAIIYVTADVRGAAPQFNPIAHFEFDLPKSYRVIENGVETSPYIDAWENEGYTKDGVFYGRYKDAYRLDTLESVPAEVLRNSVFNGIELVDDADVDEEFYLENVQIEVGGS